MAANTNAEDPFMQVYRAWHRHVRRWAVSCGAPAREVDDTIQEVFIVVRRRLPDFESGNLGAWLFRITQRIVADSRHKAWFRRVLLDGSGGQLDDLPFAVGKEEHSYEAREALKRVDAVLSNMSPKRRQTFLLFEIEGYTGEEIAELERIPLATVWTRLHYARRELKETLLANGSPQ